jgi:hypothetical protein
MASKANEVSLGVVKEVFGGSLYGFGRGYYVVLELLAILWGINKVDPTAFFSVEEPIRYARRGHDFTRRLLRDPERFRGDPGHEGAVLDEEVLLLLGDLYRGIVVPIPFRTKVPEWGGFHLFPYSGELVHYDSVDRKNKETGQMEPHIERYAYRGGGALVYELLRSDPKEIRRNETSSGLLALIGDSGSPLGRVTDVLGSADSGLANPTTDETCLPHSLDRDTGWLETLREGVCNILCSGEVNARKIDQLCHWVPFALASHQLELAWRELGESVPAIPVDISVGGALRRESQRRFDRNRRAIWQSLIARSGTKSQRASGTEREILHKLEQNGRATWNSDVEQFYSATLAVIGGINHNTGLRHYTLKQGLLDAIIAATVSDPEGVPFDDFCHEILWGRLGLVVDERSARVAGLPDLVNDAAFARNSRSLEDLLASTGLMVTLSDATRFVGASSLWTHSPDGGRE